MSGPETGLAEPADVHAFWFASPGDPEYGRARRNWFAKDDAFDARIRARFGPTIEAALQGRCEHWRESGVRDALAYIVLLDQLTRNAFRGDAAMYRGDPQALAAATTLVETGAHLQLAPFERWFSYLPFEHAESMLEQRRSVALFAAMREDPVAGGAHEWAVRHLEVIERFGRFPHRNAILGRISTPAELEYLEQPGSGF